MTKFILDISIVMLSMCTGILIDHKKYLEASLAGAGILALFIALFYIP